MSDIVELLKVVAIGIGVLFAVLVVGGLVFIIADIVANWIFRSVE